MKYHSLRRLTALCLGLALLLLATFSLAASIGNITGHVILEDTKEGAIAASVKIMELDSITKTDFEGRYTFLKVPKGVYTLRFKYIDYRPVKVDSVVVDSGLTTLQKVALKPFGTQRTEIKIKWSKPLPPTPAPPAPIPSSRAEERGLGFRLSRDNDSMRTIEPLKHL